MLQSGRRAGRATAMAGCRRLAVDCHVHVVDAATALSAASSGGYQRHVTTAEDIFGHWRAEGIVAGVLSQPSFLGLDNSCMEAALKAHPGKFAGVAVLDWDSVGEEELVRLHGLGVRGLRLNAFRGSPCGLPDLTAHAPLLRRLRELGWHVELYASCRQLVEELLPKLSEVQVVVDHFGMPSEADEASFAALLQYGAREVPVYVMLSGDFRLDGDAAWVQRCAQRLLESFGPQRLIWASDFPFTRYEDRGFSVKEQLRKLEEWVPDAEARRIVLEETPRRVFGLEGREE